MSHQPRMHSKHPDEVRARGEAATPSRTTASRPPLHPLLQLQRHVGNHAMNRLIQGKLTVHAPDDAYEREADRVATEVMRRLDAPGTPLAVRRRASDPQGAVQLKTKPLSASHGDQAGVAVAPQVETRIEQALGGGQPLAEPIKQAMEQAFGADFGDVRVHADARADRLNQSLRARAFATGAHVFFGQGNYRPSTAEGRHLIAHELTHVLQQRSAAFGSSRCGARCIQRAYADPTYRTAPYAGNHKPPEFEYWVNSMWNEVTDTARKEEALNILKNGTDSAVGSAAVTHGLTPAMKKGALAVLYEYAYTKRAWVDAGVLLAEGSLGQSIATPVSAAMPSTKIAVGFHGTGRDPNTVVNLHKGTVPTIERHGKTPTDTAGIQAYLKSQGIEEWHPFWFVGGDIASRPFLFRNFQADNELDTTVSVAKSAADSLDFPMIQDMTRLGLTVPIDPASHLPLTETYVYVVGVTQGFGTSTHLQTAVFGEGEIATKSLKAEDHLGYVKYRRLHPGLKRELGCRHDRVGHEEGVLKAAVDLGVGAQVLTIINAMPRSAYRNCTAQALDTVSIDADVRKFGQDEAATPATKFSNRAAWTLDRWEKDRVWTSKWINGAPPDRAKYLMKIFFEEIGKRYPAIETAFNVKYP